MDYMDTCKKIVDPYYLKRKGSEDYVVQVEFAPNPLNFDGVNEASAFIVQQTRGEPDVRLLTVGGCFTIEQALECLLGLVDNSLEGSGDLPTPNPRPNFHREKW